MGAPQWLGQGRDWRREIAAALAVGAFAGVLGPFGTFLFGPVWLRVAYWAGTFGLGQVLYGVGVRAAVHLAHRVRGSEMLAVLAASAVLAAPMSILCAVTDTALWPRAAHYMRPVDWYLQVLFVSAPLNFGLLWLRRRFAAPAAPSPSSPALAALEADRPGGARRVLTGDLRDRLPARLGDRIVCLQMEDHYVRIHTDRGSELVLTPLKDALAGLPGLDGLQTHRSWWVARDAVAEVVRSGRNLRLRLVNGLETPVARSAVARLRDAGWLDGEPPPPVQPGANGA